MILAINTAFKTRLAIFNKTDCIARLTQEEENIKGEQINILLKNLYKRELGENIDFKEISAIVVCLGPGLFTSLRCGLSFAKALSASLNILAYGFLLDAVENHFNVDLSTRSPYNQERLKELDNEWLKSDRLYKALDQICAARGGGLERRAYQGSNCLKPVYIAEPFITAPK